MNSGDPNLSFQFVNCLGMALAALSPAGNFTRLENMPKSAKD